MTRELGMNIQLKKVTGSEAGSDIDLLSDRGGERFNMNMKSNPATVEYFSPENPMTANRKRRIQEQKSAKRSFD